MVKHISHQSSVISHSCGFTLIEMSLVIGIFTTLIGITFISLLGPQLKSSLVAGKSVLLADIQSQQIKAMAGDSEDSDEISSYGLFFTENSYTLFRGSLYSPQNPTNKTV